MKLKYIYPKPNYYVDSITSKEYIIISTNSNESNDKSGIYSYDIQNRIYLKLTSYPKNFSMESHTHCLDINTMNLYLFFGAKCNFGIYNIKYNKWDIKINVHKKEINLI